MCSFVVGRTFLGITDLVCFERYVGYVQVESSPVWLGLKMSQASPRFLKNDHRDDFLQTIYFTGKMDPVVHHSLYWMHFLPKNMGFFRISMDFLKFPHRKSLQNPAWKEAWKLSVSRPVLPQVNFTVDLLLLVGRNPVPNHRLDAPGTRELTGFPPFKGTFKSMIFQTSLWYVSFLEGIKPCK